MSDLEIPGRTKLPVIHHTHDRAGQIHATLNTPNGVEIHTIGGYSRLESAAIELAKEAARGCAAPIQGNDKEVDPGDLGRWAARAASALLEECQAIQASGGRVEKALTMPSRRATRAAAN